MNILKEFSLNDKCSYLKDKEQTTYYKMINNCSDVHCQDLIERGFRRFGKMFFRPICSECDECQSIKVDVKNFTYSKSMRRVIKKGSHFKSYIRKPSLTQEHLDLFDKYHKFMKDKKGWDYQKTTANNYYSSFVDGHNEFGYEILYFDDNKLIGVDLIDILDDGLSSIYFYYDPDYTFAKTHNKKWIYLGYYVEDCPSLSYKSHYKPYLTLNGRPDINESFKWL